MNWTECSEDTGGPYSTTTTQSFPLPEHLKGNYSPEPQQFGFVPCGGHESLFLILKPVYSAMLKPTLQGAFNKNENHMFEKASVCFCNSRKHNRVELLSAGSQ